MLAGLAWLAWSQGSWASEGTAALSALKAAYTFHFLNLIQWGQPTSSLELCLLGESEAGDRMQATLENKSVHGQVIRARRVSLEPVPGERCDAVYIPATYAEHALRLLKRYEGSATVTISDIPQFTGVGGVIGFVVIDDRLRFEINERVAAQKGVRISARLLELARGIIRP